ncbi:unnamed protein product [Larinioides sclopetarius]|uniref:Protein LMBR1L n=2 Tax=Larinioides sclopetarius TaxID=280406 RepID=A0AAV1ZJ19_9ARAC
MELDEDPEDWKKFYNKTREYVVFLLLFITLYFTSYCLILIFKKKNNGLYTGTYEDAVAYRIALWVCTFSLGVSIGAALLLPMSIISNEVLLAYPNSYYVQWLNTSLIQGMWNLVFLFSNLALFLFLPFSHFFIESEGFPGSSKGVMARVYEATLVLILVGVLLMGITYIMSALLDDGHYSIASFFNVSNHYLPFLYSCVSFLGVLMLLICTPVGFAHLFTVTGKLLTKLKTPRLHLQQDDHQRIDMSTGSDSLLEDGNIQLGSSLVKSPSCSLMHRRKAYQAIPFEQYEDDKSSYLNEDGLDRMVAYLQIKESKVRHTAFKRNFLYPLMMILLVLLTVVSGLMVTQNTLELCFGIKTLPVYTQNLSLGINSLSSLGPIGAALEIILILYLWCTSIIGLYSLPLFCYLKPKVRNTSMTQVIGNCAILLILSSALPVLARSLGITNFDLLGDFGRINWLGNFYIVVFHNIVFAVTTAVCLGTKITATVRNELYNRICNFHRYSMLYVFL